MNAHQDEELLKTMTMKKGTLVTQILAPILFVSLLVSGCSGTSATESDAQTAAKPLTGDDSNPACKMFSAAEVAKYFGRAVSAGHTSTMGLACQWDAIKGDGDVIIAVVPAGYHERPTHAKGFKEVPDVGTKGFVATQADGWIAGAIVGKDAIKVTVEGAAAGEATAVALLKDAIKRRPS